MHALEERLREKGTAVGALSQGMNEARSRDCQGPTVASGRMPPL